ncbi:hypothetical protein SPC83_03505 [Streptococcus sp. 21WXBC0057M1]|uniref:Alkaline shock response membrane anchor protein AmaP n=1 Tax=Streptococcus wuxiensis TaxID=3095078 RepID=A0ABU5FQI3_9STRE|nr:hypothetical protein [Streptococcus sp. 21WXBC0057M1]MDY4337193.1 hypothetical protein [Streptococcus sp. 21WXBC0057M1]
MKKNFFQRSFNITVTILMYGLFFLCLTIGLRLLQDLMANAQSTYLSHLFDAIKQWASKGEYYTNILAILLPLIAVFLIIVELILRAIYDKPSNYFRSAYQTLRLIQFLRQDENSQLAFSIDNSSTVTRFNPILRKFNRATSKCVVDVRKDSVTILIKYPKTQQSQKLLREMENYIKEEISSRNPEYYFSAPNRQGNKLWFKSTKR